MKTALPVVLIVVFFCQTIVPMYFTLGNDFNMDLLDDLVATIDDHTGKLVADIDAELPSRVQHPPALMPNPAQIQQVFVKCFPVADLPFRPVVLDVPQGGEITMRCTLSSAISDMLRLLAI